MTYKLVKWQIDYADEFDVCAFYLADTETYEKDLKESQRIIGEHFERFNVKYENHRARFYEIYQEIYDQLSSGEITNKYDYNPSRNSSKFRNVPIVFSLQRPKEEAFDEWKSLLIDEEGGGFTKYFGTNECIVFISPEDYFDSFSVTDISQQEYDIIKKHFGERWGTSSYFFPLEQ